MRLRGSHALGKVPIDLLCAPQLFLAAGSHLAWSLRQGREKELVTPGSGPPRGPREPGAGPEVVLGPGLCSRVTKGRAEDRGLDGWRIKQDLLGGGGALLRQLERAGSCLNCCCESPECCPGKAGLG